MMIILYYTGLPVAANCSAKEDKHSCAKVCRQLIQAMSDNSENSALVQTVVQTATRALACQRFNESHKVPLPRTILDSEQRTLVKLDEEKGKWKFFMGPTGRRDVSEEPSNGGGIKATPPEHHLDENGEILEEFLTEPKWLGGFYRWCDEHWVYAGVSLDEPLCCYRHLPQAYG